MQRLQTGGRTRALLVLALSIGAAAVAVLVVLRVVRTAEQEVVRAQQTTMVVDVVVAARDLNVGLPISAEDVVLRSLHKDAVPPEDIFSTRADLVGRTPRERILANEIVRDARLAVADAGVGLNALVSPGKRAMTVDVNSATGVAGFLQPGNYVDVIVTIRPDEGAKEKRWVSHAFLQGVKVLAVGRNLRPGVAENDASRARSAAREKPTVTIEVDLEQAEALALSSTRGDVHLVLRNDIDVTQVDTQGTLTSSLVGKGAPEKEEPARPRARQRRAPQPASGPVSEVIHGDKVEEVKFQEDGSKTVSSPSSRRR